MERTNRVFGLAVRSPSEKARSKDHRPHQHEDNENHDRQDPLTCLPVVKTLVTDLLHVVDGREQTDAPAVPWDPPLLVNVRGRCKTGRKTQVGLVILIIETEHDERSLPPDEDVRRNNGTQCVVHVAQRDSSSLPQKACGERPGELRKSSATRCRHSPQSAVPPTLCRSLAGDDVAHDRTRCPPTVSSLDRDRKAETGRDGGRGQDVGRRADGHKTTVADQSCMRDADRYLLYVVGDQDQRWGLGIAGQGSKICDQSFASTEIETGGGFVEEKQLGFRHQGTGQKDLLSFPLGQNSDESGRFQQSLCMTVVVLVEAVPPCLECGVTAGEDDIMGGESRAQPTQYGLAHEGDATTDGTGIAATVGFPQDLDGAAGRKQAHARHAQQGRLP